MTTHAVAQIRTTHEIAFAQRLAERGIECYCPTVVVMSRPWGKRHKTNRVQVPRFPSYIFVALGTIQFLHSVYQDSRFGSFLRSERHGEIGTVCAEDMARLRALEGREVTKAHPVPGFIDGDLAKPSGGIFGGLAGRVRLGNEGQIWLEGYKFAMPVQFTDASALILLESDVKYA